MTPLPQSPAADLPAPIPYPAAPAQRPASAPADPQTLARQSPRLKLAVMYTLVRVRRRGESRYRWTGHIYDLSAAGMRFELDSPIEPGTGVEVRAMLPGAEQVVFRAAGTVARVHTDAEDRAGPVTMGLVFERFPNPTDRQRLLAYLNQRGLPAAA